MEDLKEMKEILKALMHRNEVQGAQIEQIIFTMSSMQGAILDMQAAISDNQKTILDVQSDVKDIKSELIGIREGQERQDRILEALAARSLEQETSIKELRRAR